MKVYVILVHYTDEEGNLGGYSELAFSKEEAINTVRKLHEAILEDYVHYTDYDVENEVDDDYEDGDDYFDINLAEDSFVRTVVETEEKNIWKIFQKGIYKF